MAKERRLDILEAGPDVRELAGACELTGERTIFTRNDRPVSILISYDEYVALRETIALNNDADMRAKIEAAEELVKKNALLLVEDLPWSTAWGAPAWHWNDRLRLAESVEEEWRALANHERESVRNILRTIDEDPITGAPLFEPLRGFWSFREGHLRVVYRIFAEARFVVILTMGRVAD